MSFLTFTDSPIMKKKKKNTPKNLKKIKIKTKTKKNEPIELTLNSLTQLDDRFSTIHFSFNLFSAFLPMTK